MFGMRWTCQDEKDSGAFGIRGSNSNKLPKGRGWTPPCVAIKRVRLE